MIEVGEYIRTMDGKIGVFVKYSSRKEDSLYKSPANCFIRLNNRKSDLQCFRDYIKKHSKNIIDLIEENDFINGMEVYEFDDEEGTVLGIPIFEDGLFDTIDCYVPLESIKIHSILTREMYEANCYKVEEEI